MNVNSYKTLVEEELLPNITLTSPNPKDPIVVEIRTKEWKIVGSGNFASVFSHPSNDQLVVKVYGRDLEAIKEEIKVYKKLGDHKAYSKLYGYGKHYLLLKRIHGMTLYDAVIKGLPIPPQVMEDIEEAIEYAKQRGLNPYDVHGKNIVMNEGKGIIVDVSDFYKTGTCKKWPDLKRAYSLIYKPFLLRRHPRIPVWSLNAARRLYRFTRGVFKYN